MKKTRKEKLLDALCENPPDIVRRRKKLPAKVWDVKKLQSPAARKRERLRAARVGPRPTPTNIESVEDGLYLVAVAVGFFLRIRLVEKPQTREELPNASELEYRTWFKAIKQRGDRVTPGLILKRLVEWQKQYVVQQNLILSYPFSSGTKKTEREKTERLAIEALLPVTWKERERRRIIKMDVQAITSLDDLTKLDKFIMSYLLDGDSKADIVRVLKANDVPNARKIVDDAEALLHAAAVMKKLTN